MKQTSKQVKRIYEAVLRESPTRRRAYLDRICGGDRAVRMRVERLLDARENVGDFLADPTRARPTELPPGIEEFDVPTAPPAVAPVNGEVNPGERRGTMIGRYKLLQKIGEGGFGDVYMAAQSEPVRRKVALKIIKLGMDTDQVVARFEAERQALALMDHPNIARILDGGATENGRPYFVMDLVRGVPITEYCDTARLDTHQRLALFRQVCHAVQHAHTKGIIHRDIKPSNVLVTLHDGVPVPKVIDFGIAKAIDRTLTDKTLFTQFQQMIGTPEYMSPEQAEMSGLDIDTRADVYSLGVLLYELLTGSKPFDMQRLLKRGYEELLRTIREEDPPRPSTRVSTLGQREIGRVTRGHATSQRQLGTSLRGDLDWIVMRALEKDRQRRYETASALADDVQRHLDHQPVLASPPTTLYRMRKYVRRHRAGVVAATLVTVAMLAGTSAATWGWLEASDQRSVTQQALRNEQQARAHESVQRRRAVAGEKLAKRERDEKELARAALEKALRRSEGTRLSALSQAMLPRDPALALLLAIEGAARETNAYANRALLEALEQAPRREIALATDGDVIDAAWSPDESRIATGTKAGTLELWDPRTGKRLRALKTDHGTVVWLRWRGAAILAGFMSSNGTEAGSVLLSWNPATGATRTLVRRDQNWCVSTPGILGDTIPIIEPATESVILFSLTSGEVVHQFSGLGPLQLWQWPRLSPDKKRFLTVPFAGGNCRLHDATTGNVIAEWPYSGTVSNSAAFSSDGRWVVSDEGTRGVRVRAARDGSLICTLRGTARSSAFAFTASGETLLSTGGTIRAWDASTGEMLRDLDFQAAYGSALAPDGRTLVSRQHRSGIEFRSLSAGEKMLTLANRGWIRAVASDWRILVADPAGTRIVDPQTAGQSLFLQGNVNPCAFAVHPDGRHIVDITGFSAEEGRVWDLKSRRPLRYLPVHHVYVNGSTFSQVYDADFSPDGSRFATVGGMGEMFLWKGVSGEPLSRVRVADPGHSEQITSVEFSPDGRLIALAGTMSRVRVHDAQNGDELFRLGDAPEREQPNYLQVGLGSGRLVAFSPDGSRLMLRYKISAPRVYDLASQRKLFELAIDDGHRVLAASYSSCGRWICVSTNENGNIRDGESVLFDAATGKRLRTLRGINGRGPLFGTGFGPRGDRFVTCVGGQGVLLYDVATGNRLMALRVPGELPSRACFSPDGRWVLGVSHQSFEVYVWNATNGLLLHHLTDGSANSFFHNASFTKDSRSIITLTKRGIRVLPVDLRAAAVRLRPRDLTPEECATYDIPEPALRAPPAVWRQSNGIASVSARAKQVDGAVKELRKLLGSLYDEDALRFRQRAAYIGIEDDLAWPLKHVANWLSRRHAHYDEAVEVYRYALREAIRAYGDEDLRVSNLRLALTRILAWLGRGREIGPHLDALERVRKLVPAAVALRHGYFLLASGKPKQAIEAFDKAGHKRRQEADQGIAEAYMDLGDYEEAANMLNGTLHFGRGSPAGLYYLSLRMGVRRALRLYTKLNDADKIAAWRELEKNIEQVRPAPIAKAADTEPTAGK